jgi:predicted acylesterase/phospholipase RssA
LAQFPLGHAAEGARCLSALLEETRQTEAARWGGRWRTRRINWAALARNELDAGIIAATGNKLRVAAIDSSGRLRVFSEAHPSIVSAVAAASAHPGFDAPVVFGGETWVGTAGRGITPIQMAYEMGSSDISAVLTAPLSRRVSGFHAPAAEATLAEQLSEEVYDRDVVLIARANALRASATLHTFRPSSLREIRPARELSSGFTYGTDDCVAARVLGAQAAVEVER